MEKRGISTIIATVIVILITVTAAVVISTIIIPMLRNKMDESKTCYDLRDILSLGDYTCYNITATYVMIKRTANNETQIDRLIFSLTAGGDGKNYEIAEGSIPSSEVSMYDLSSPLKIPKAGGAKTYVFDLPNADYVDIAVMSNNVMCEVLSEKLYLCGTQK